MKFLNGKLILIVAWIIIFELASGGEQAHVQKISNSITLPALFKNKNGAVVYITETDNYGPGTELLVYAFQKNGNKIDPKTIGFSGKGFLPLKRHAKDLTEKYGFDHVAKPLECKKIKSRKVRAENHATEFQIFRQG